MPGYRHFASNMLILAMSRAINTVRHSRAGGNHEVLSKANLNGNNPIAIESRPVGNLKKWNLNISKRLIAAVASPFSLMKKVTKPERSESMPAVKNNKRKGITKRLASFLELSYRNSYCGNMEAPMKNRDFILPWVVVCCGVVKEFQCLFLRKSARQDSRE